MKWLLSELHMNLKTPNVTLGPDVQFCPNVTTGGPEEVPLILSVGFVLLCMFRCYFAVFKLDRMMLPSNSALWKRIWTDLWWSEVELQSDENNMML